MKRAVTGLRAWLVQRVSAVYMLFFILFLLSRFLITPALSYVAWHDWVMDPRVSIAFFVFFVALLLHVWVGIRDIIMDYVRPFGLRITALSLLGISLVAIATWIIQILLIGRG